MIFQNSIRPPNIYLFVSCKKRITISELNWNTIVVNVKNTSHEKNEKQLGN